MDRNKGRQRRQTDTKPESLRLALHPHRTRILARLGQSSSYPSLLARELDLNPKLIQFHLSALEKANLVSGMFELESTGYPRPRAVKSYALTEDGLKILSLVASLVTFE